MEMIQVMLNYPQIHTDMAFENIPTVPLEQHAGMECNSKRGEFDSGCNDGDELISLSYIIRREKSFPSWRQHRPQELLMIQGTFDSPISVDKVTKYSVRPPELRHVIRTLGHYYRWFFVKNERIGREKLELILMESLHTSVWIDGLQNHVLVRVKAFDEISTFLDDLVINEEIDHPVTVIKTYLLGIIQLYQEFNSCDDIESGDRYDKWCFIKEHMIYDDSLKHLPIPVYSYVKPTMGPRFLLHVMSSLGEFDTEVDLLLHHSIRESLRYAKLIGVLDDLDSLQQYSNLLLKKYIEEQLVYFPNSGVVLEQWIVTAGNMFDSVILRNEIPITDMPPCHQTALNQSKDEEVVKLCQQMRSNLIGAAFREMGSNTSLYGLPSQSDINSCCRGTSLSWDPIANFKKSSSQSDQSYQDQKTAITTTVAAIDQYIDCSSQSTFVRCRVICGSPGSGKSFLLNYVALYAMSIGLNVAITALMAQRAIHLGGLHLHKLFILPVKQSHNVHAMAESSLQALMRNPVTLNVLKAVDVLCLDEIGQISSQMLSCLDLILRRVRNNNIFLGGMLFICTLDHKQLQPINGKPFLVSPMVLTCFKFISLSESVRASGDIPLHRIQHIARMHPQHYEDNPNLISEFKDLLLSTCTFVDNWDDDIISPTTYRLYGKKYPARKACQEYIDQVRSHVGQYGSPYDPQEFKRG